MPPLLNTQNHIESTTISKNLPFHFVKQFPSESAKVRTSSSPNSIFELILKNSFGGGRVTASDLALTQVWLFAQNVSVPGRTLSTNCQNMGRLFGPFKPE